MEKKSDRGLIFLQFFRLSCHWNVYCYLWCRWEKLLPMVSFFCYCLWCNLVTKSKSSYQWCTLAFGAVITMSESHILTFEILFWHSNWVGKCYFDIQNPILLFELRGTIVFLHSKSYFDIRNESENHNFDIRNESENAILIFEILFWHSKWVGKSYFDFQNPILTFEMSRKMLFWYSKSYFDIRSESENRILTFKILFWLSKWVGKCYFDIQNPILTFELSRKIVFWHSKFYFDIQTDSENRFLAFKILFWHSNWVGKCYYEIKNPILTLELSRKIVFWQSKF